MKSLEEVLGSMEYPGRFLIVGRSLKDKTVVVYGITGRRESSQARELVEGKNTGVIRTEVTDPKVLEEGSEALLIYPAIIPVTMNAHPPMDARHYNPNFIVASNGYQTHLLNSLLMSEWNGFPEVLHSINLIENKFSEITIISAFFDPVWIYDKKEDRFIDVTTYEPDSNKTPRINLVASTEEACLHIVRCGKDGQKEEGHPYFDLSSFKKGEARFISTYNGVNQEPLQSFEGEPLELKLSGETPEQTAKAVYEALAPKQGKLDLRVGVACVYFGKEGFEKAIINRDSEVRKCRNK